MQVEAPKKLFSARGRAITCRSRVLVTPKPSPKTLNPERKTVNPKPKLRSPKWHLPSAVFFVAFAPSRCGSSQCSRSLSRPRAAPRNYMRSEFKIRVCGSGFHVLDILSYTLQREREREIFCGHIRLSHSSKAPTNNGGALAAVGIRTPLM